jgi:hypothetical protein
MSERIKNASQGKERRKAGNRAIVMQYTSAMMTLHANIEARFVEDIGTIFPHEKRTLHRTIFAAVQNYAVTYNMPVDVVIEKVIKSGYVVHLFEALKSRPESQRDALIQEYILQMLS